MVIGAHVEQLVVVVVPPAYHLAGRLRQPGGHARRPAAAARLHLRQQPGARDNGMSLEEFQRSGSLHLGRDHAYQIILYSDTVHRSDPAVFDDEFQRAGKGLVLLPFPMEPDPDGHPIEDERGLREKRRAGDGVENEFIVEHSAIVYLPFPVADLLGAGSVGDDFEADLRAGHDADLDFALAAFKAPDYVALDLRPYGRFVEQTGQQPGVQLCKVLRVRDYQISGNIGAARSHGKMVGAVAVEMMRAVAVAEHDDGTVFRPVVPDEEVEFRFLIPFRKRYALKQAVEELSHGLGGSAPERE